MGNPRDLRLELFDELKTKKKKELEVKKMELDWFLRRNAITWIISFD